MNKADQDRITEQQNKLMAISAQVHGGSRKIDEFSELEQRHIVHCIVQTTANRKRHADWYADYDKQRSSTP